MRLGFFFVAITLLPSCLIAKRDNICDPSAPTYDAEACRTACNQVSCGPDEGPSVIEGCVCLPCSEIECGPKEYRVACGCVPLHGTLDCDAGGTCNLTCDSGYESCDSNVMNGCETNLVSDAAHCGACNRSCGGATCTDGRCAPVKIASGVRFPLYDELIADETHVYFGVDDDSGDGFVRRVSVTGGGQLDYSTGGEGDELRSLTFDGNSIYWCRTAPGGDAIVRATKDRAGVTVVRSLDTGRSEDCSGTRALQVRGSDIYAKVYPSGGPQELWFARGANAPSVIDTRGSAFMTGDASDIFFVDEGGSIQSVPVGSASETLVVSGANPEAIAVDATHVFWATDSALFRAPREGGTPQMLATPGTARAILAAGVDIHVDDTHVYWYRDDQLRRVPKAGGEPEVIGTLDRGVALTGNSTAVFISDTLSGISDLWRFTK